MLVWSASGIYFSGTRHIWGTFSYPPSEEAPDGRAATPPNGMDTSLEWKIVVDQRRFTSGNRTVEGEEEDRNNQRGTK